MHIVSTSTHERNTALLTLACASHGRVDAGAKPLALFKYVSRQEHSGHGVWTRRWTQRCGCGGKNEETEVVWRRADRVGDVGLGRRGCWGATVRGEDLPGIKHTDRRMGRRHMDGVKTVIWIERPGFSS